MYHNPLVTVLSALITIAITVTFMSHSFFQFSSKVFISLFAFLQFYPVVSRNGKVHYSTGSCFLFFFSFFFFFFFLLSITRSGRLAEIIWSVCILESQRVLCISLSRRDSGLCIYHLFVMVNFKLFAQFSVDDFSTLSCLVLYSFVLIYCIRLLCDWSFRLYHYIIYICYFLCFVFLYILSLWCCFALLSEEIHFPCRSFHLLAMSEFSRVRFRLFVP